MVFILERAGKPTKEFERIKTLDGHLLIEIKNSQGLINGIIELSPCDPYVRAFVSKGWVRIISQGVDGLYSGGYRTCLYKGDKIDIGRGKVYVLKRGR